MWTMLRHSLLFVYGLLPAHGGIFNRDDADANFVPGLVASRCCGSLGYSTTNLDITYVPAASVLLQGLSSAIHTRDTAANLTAEYELIRVLRLECLLVFWLVIRAQFSVAFIVRKQ